MDIGSSQHSGAISSSFLGGSSHSYPYMPEIGDSSVKKAVKKPRASASSSRAENHSRDGSGLTVFGPPGNPPSESNLPSVRNHPIAGNPPSGDDSPSERAQRHQWIHPFCQEPENDLPTCCLGWWLPCCLYGKTQYRLLQMFEGLDPLDEARYKPCDGACWGFACVEIWFGASCKQLSPSSPCTFGLVMIIFHGRSTSRMVFADQFYKTRCLRNFGQD